MTRAFHRLAGFRVSAAAAAMACGLGLFAAQPAAAAVFGVTESSTITNSFSYSVGRNSPVVQGNGPSKSVVVQTGGAGNTAEMGLSYDSELDNGNFSFLHDAYCVGQCNLNIVTEIVFTLVNNSGSDQDIRFDSLITPGHLARASFDPQSNPGGILAIFDFDVTQNLDGKDFTLYSADGSAADMVPSVQTSSGVFNGLHADFNDPNWSVLDWSATNLNVDLLTLAAGATTTLTYRSDLMINSSFVCSTFIDCPGFHVAFGDPRNIGGVVRSEVFQSLMALGGLAGPQSTMSAGVAAVGSAYDEYGGGYNFVGQGSPTPAAPPVIAPIPYTTGFIASAVPEPQTWAMLLIGFAAIGGAIRRGNAHKGGLLRA